MDMNSEAGGRTQELRVLFSRARRVVSSWGSLLALIGITAYMVNDVGLSPTLVMVVLGVIGVVSVVLLNGYLSITERLHNQQIDLARERQIRRELAKEREEREERFKAALEALLEATSSGNKTHADRAAAASRLAQDISGFVAAEVAADWVDLNEKGHVDPVDPHRVVPT